MKIIERNIPNYREGEIFAPIRDKLDYIKTLMLAMELILLPNYDKKNTNSRMRLVIDKMNRLFFYSSNKYFSIAFPFNVNDENISTYLGTKIDYKNISAVKSILNSQQYKMNKSLRNLDIEPESLDLEGISLLEEFLLFEPCYVRYDYDPARLKGKLHPLCHFDINYSQYGTFKIGLNNRIAPNDFEDFHNIKKDCLFLQ